VLQASFRAGVGSIGIALVGCGDDPNTEPSAAPQASRGSQDEPQSAQADDQQQQRTEPATAASTDQGASQTSQQAGQRADTSREGQSEAAQSRQPSSQQHQSNEPLLDLVDPIEWRERYHWRTLAALHDPPRTPVPGGTLTVESNAVRSWDPLAPWNPEVDRPQPGHLLPLVYSRLIELDISDQSDAHRTLIRGDLATGWEWLEPTAVAFTLRPGVIWPEQSPAEGRPLSGVDVALSYDALREPGRRQTPIYEAVDRIEAGDNANSGDSSVTFHLREPSAPLLNQMTSPWHVVLPAEIVSGAQEIDLTQRSVGTGPFEIKLSDGRSSWVLSRNPTYGRSDHDGIPLPYLDEVRGEHYPFRDYFANAPAGGAKWAAWEEGSAHAIKLDSVEEAHRALLSQPDAQLQVTPPIPSGGGYYSFASLNEGPFADNRVRAALSMALHRTNLAALTYNGFAAPGVAQNWTFFRDTQSPDQTREWPWSEAELAGSQRYDPDQALTLLSAAGYSDANPLRMRIDMPPALDPAGASYDAGAHRIAPFVADQWEQYLLNAVDVHRTERIWTPYTDSEGRQGLVPKPDQEVDLIFQHPEDADIYNADADDLAYGAMHSAGRYNYAGINDAEVDAWSVAQRQAVDQMTRADLLERIRRKEQEHVWRLLLVNPYSVRVRRAGVYNLLDTYYANTPQLAPAQLKTVWIDA